MANDEAPKKPTYKMAHNARTSEIDFFLDNTKEPKEPKEPEGGFASHVPKDYKSQDVIDKRNDTWATNAGKPPSWRTQ